MSISYSEKLRALASYLERHPELNEEQSSYWSYPQVSFYLYLPVTPVPEEGESEEDENENFAKRVAQAEIDTEIRKDKFRRFSRSITPFEKGGYGGTVTATHEERLDITNEPLFTITVALAGACDKVPVIDPSTGEQKVRVVPGRPAQPEVPESTEPEFEWKCPDKFLII